MDHNSINVNDNLTNIAVGDKLLIDAGIINTVILGNWNRLVAGSSTIIELGTKISANLANVTSITKGSSWHYSNSRKTISNTDLKSAMKNFEIFGGTTDTELARFMQENLQSKFLLFAIITSFLFTIGVSLLGIQCPAFSTNKNYNPDDNTNDPSTGEIIAIDTTISSNPQTVYALLFGSLSIVIIFFGQWVMARRIASQYSTFKPVSYLLQNNQNIKAMVFSEPGSPTTSAYAKLHFENNYVNHHNMMSLISKENKNDYGIINLTQKNINISTCYEENHASIILSSNHDNNILQGTNLNINHEKKCHVSIESSYKYESSIIYIDLEQTMVYTNHPGLIEISFCSTDTQSVVEADSIDNELDASPFLLSSTNHAASTNNYTDSEEDSAIPEGLDTASAIQDQGLILSQPSHPQNGIDNSKTESLQKSALTISNQLVSLTTNQRINGIYISNKNIMIANNRKVAMLFSEDSVTIGSTIFGTSQFSMGNNGLIAQLSDQHPHAISSQINNEQNNNSIVKIRAMLNLNRQLIMQKIST